MYCTHLKLYIISTALEIYQVNELARNSRVVKPDNLRCSCLIIFVFVPCITVIALSRSEIISAAYVTTVNEYCLAEIVIVF